MMKLTDLVIISTHGRTGFRRWMLGSVANQIIQSIVKPVLLVRPREGETPPTTQFKRLLVTLDGSEFAERVLPYVRASTRLESEVLLLCVPEVPEAHRYGAILEEILYLRQQAETQSQEYLCSIANALHEEGIKTRVLIKGSRPAKTIVSVAQEENADVVMLATHGLGGFDRLFLGSVADRVMHQAPCPVFLVPIHERRPHQQQLE